MKSYLPKHDAVKLYGTGIEKVSVLEKELSTLVGKKVQLAVTLHSLEIKSKTVSLTDIESVVLQYQLKGSNYTSLFGNEWKRDIVELRKVFYYIAVNSFGYSMRDISRYINLHYTTVRSGITSIRKKMNSDENIFKMINEATQQLLDGNH